MTLGMMFGGQGSGGTPGGGAGLSGNYNFTLAQSKFETGPSDPGVVTPSGVITPGNLMVVVCGERSGEDPANHVVTDANGKTWNRISALNFDNAVSGNEGNTRMSFSVWWRVVDTTGETDLTPAIECDIGTSSVHMLWCEISADSAYNWNFSAGTVAGSGASDWNGQSSGSTTSSGNDIFELAIAMCRCDGTNEPSASLVAFSTQTDGYAEVIGGPNQMTAAMAFEAVSQASGSMSATITSDGSGNEGVVAIATWSD